MNTTTIDSEPIFPKQGRAKSHNWTPPLYLRSRSRSHSRSRRRTSRRLRKRLPQYCACGKPTNTNAVARLCYARRRSLWIIGFAMILINYIVMKFHNVQRPCVSFYFSHSLPHISCTHFHSLSLVATVYVANNLQKIVQDCTLHKAQGNLKLTRNQQT